MARTGLILGLLILAHCAESNDKGEAPPQDPVRSQTRPAPLTGVGSTWTSGAIRGEAAAVFVSAAREPLFSIMCGGEPGILLQRHFSAASEPAAAMELQSGTKVRSLQTEILRSPSVVLRAILPYGDSFLADLEEMDAPLGVSSAGAPRLDLPANPMVGEFIRDCRRRL